MPSDLRPYDPGSTVLHAALGYAAQGFRVVPLKPGEKTPLIRQWQDRATTDPAEIRKWFGRRSHANLAILTGGGVVALDIDPRNGGNGSLRRLLGRRHLPETAFAKTGNEGLHYLFRVGEGETHRCSNGILPGIDVKGDGGYLVVEPSVHPETGREYRWERTPRQGIAAMPDWLREAVLPGPRPTSLPRSSAAPTGDRVGASDVLLAEAVARFPVVRAGIRHDRMNRVIGSLLGRGYPEDLVEEVVAAWWGHFHRLGLARTPPTGARASIRACIRTTLANPSFGRAVGVDHIAKALELRFDAWGVLEALLGRRVGDQGRVIVPPSTDQSLILCNRLSGFANPVSRERAFVDAWACYSAYKARIGECPMKMTAKQVSTIMTRMGVPEPTPPQYEKLLRKYVSRPEKPSIAFELALQTQKGRQGLPSEFVPTGVLDLLQTVSGLAA